MLSRQQKYLLSENVLEALKERKKPLSKILRVDFLTGGIDASPGRIQLYKTLLDTLWVNFGTVEQTFYSPTLAYCILEFSSHMEAAMARSFLENKDKVALMLEKVSVKYTVEDENFFAVRALMMIFGAKRVVTEWVYDPSWMTSQL